MSLPLLKRWVGIQPYEIVRPTIGYVSGRVGVVFARIDARIDQAVSDTHCGSTVPSIRMPLYRLHLLRSTRHTACGTGIGCQMSLGQPRLIVASIAASSEAKVYSFAKAEDQECAIYPTGLTLAFGLILTTQYRRLIDDTNNRRDTSSWSWRSRGDR